MRASVLSCLFWNRSRMMVNDWNVSAGFVATLLLILPGVGCGGPTGYEEVRGPLQSATLTIKGKKISVEVATDPYSRNNGLMFREPESLGQDDGMLFFSPQKQTQSFFMKGTKIPLSIAFVDDDGKILQIEDMQSFDLNSTISKEECRWALEMHQGWFSTNGVAEGDAFDEFQASVKGAVGTF